MQSRCLGQPKSEPSAWAMELGLSRCQLLVPNLRRVRASLVATPSLSRITGHTSILLKTLSTLSQFPALLKNRF